MFKKDDTEAIVYETRRAKQLDLRIHRRLRAKTNLKERAEAILKKSIFENFLLINSEDQKKHRLIPASEFNQNQNKFYKNDIDTKIGEFYMTFCRNINKFTLKDFENLKQLVLYMVKQTCESIVWLQFSQNEVNQLLDLKDFLYSELLNSHIALSEQAIDYHRVKEYLKAESSRKEEEVIMRRDWDRMKKNLYENEASIRDFNINLLNLNNQLAVIFFFDQKIMFIKDQNKKSALYKRKLDKVLQENHNLKDQLILSMGKMQNYASKSNEVDVMRDRLKDILKEVQI